MPITGVQPVLNSTQRHEYAGINTHDCVELPILAHIVRTVWRHEDFTLWQSPGSMASVCLVQL